MFCSECGKKVTGKFCSECGCRLLSAAGGPSPLVDDLTTDWSQIVDYEVLLKHREVRDRIARAASEATAGVTGEQFLEFCEKALAPLTVVPIPYGALAKILQPLHASLGIKTGKMRTQSFSIAPGVVLVGVLCSLARHGRKLKEANQVSNGCLLTAELPSDLLALAGTLKVNVYREGTGSRIEAATHIPGQMFDWGKSTRCLDQLLAETCGQACAAA